jgi:SAM-dependent methyltransferase
MADEISLPPLRSALIAQFLGTLIAIGLIALVSPRTLGQPLTIALAQGVCSAFTAYKLGARPWWLPIHLGFMPLIVVASRLPIEPGWHLACFLLLLVIYWRVGQSQVPLYLSNKATALSVAALLPETQCRIIDLGCGNGVFLRRLAELRPDCTFVGIEYAPLPWLWARFACAGIENCRIARGDYWQTSLADFDLVYAFLSPVPMPALWEKACKEMKVGALLVSNSFAVPDHPAERTVNVPDRRKTRLFCYCPVPA